MIVVCPECKTNYTIPDEILLGDDKLMKCNKCSHQWLEMGKREISSYDDNEQEGEEINFEEALSQIEKTLDEENSEEVDEEEDVEESEEIINIDLIGREEGDVGQSQESSKDYIKEKKPNKQASKRKNSKGGYIAGAFTALVLFTIVFIVLLILRSPVIKYIPASQALYSTMGFDIPVEGEGLVFDRIDTSWNGTSLAIKGSIINLLPVDYTIPRIELIFQSKDNTILDKAIFSVSDNKIKGEDLMFFEYEIQVMSDVKNETENITLSFIVPE